MWKVDQKLLAGVSESLEKLPDVCRRCILRCAGVRHSPMYKSNFKSEISSHSENDKEEGNSASKRPKLKQQTCRLCLGLLSDDFLTCVTTKVKESLEKDPYEVNDFTFALSLPASLALRNHSVGLMLSSVLEDFDGDDVVPIKQVNRTVDLDETLQQ